MPKCWTVVLEETLESHLDSKIKPVNHKGNQPWIFIWRTDAKAEAPILWPPDVKSHLIGKDLDAGKDWGQEKKRVTEDEMVGWHHWLNGHESEQTPEDSEGQGSLACCCSLDYKELNKTERTTENKDGTNGKEPACQCRRHETWVQSLGQEDPLGRTQQHTLVFLTGESHGQRSPYGLQSLGSQRVGHYWSNLAYMHAYVNLERIDFLEQY